MRLAVFVTPKALRNAVVGWREGADNKRELAVHVNASPEKGKATKAAGKVLAAFFGVPQARVKCTRGATSRHKIFELPIDEQTLHELTDKK